jgi:hypothetical protein
MGWPEAKSRSSTSPKDRCRSHKLSCGLRATLVVTRWSFLRATNSSDQSNILQSVIMQGFMKPDRLPTGILLCFSHNDASRRSCLKQRILRCLFPGNLIANNRCWRTQVDLLQSLPHRLKFSIKNFSSRRSLSLVLWRFREGLNLPFPLHVTYEFMRDASGKT